MLISGKGASINPPGGRSEKTSRTFPGVVYLSDAEAFGEFSIGSTEVLD